MSGKASGDDVAVKRVPAAQLQDVRAGSVTREGATERAQSGEPHRRGGHRCQADRLSGLRLGIDNQVAESFERLRDQSRAATCDVKDDPGGRSIAKAGRAADPCDVHDPLLCRHSRDRLLHERVLQLVAADLAECQVQPGGGQPRAYGKSDLLVLHHGSKRARASRGVSTIARNEPAVSRQALSADASVTTSWISRPS